MPAGSSRISRKRWFTRYDDVKFVLRNKSSKSEVLFVVSRSRFIVKRTTTRSIGAGAGVGVGPVSVDARWGVEVCTEDTTDKRPQVLAVKSDSHGEVSISWRDTTYLAAFVRSGDKVYSAFLLEIYGHTYKEFHFKDRHVPEEAALLEVLDDLAQPMQPLKKPDDNDTVARDRSQWTSVIVIVAVAVIVALVS